MIYQNSKDESRVLKDYFISQIGKFQNEFDDFTSKVYSKELKCIEIHNNFYKFQSQVQILEKFIEDNYIIKVELFRKIISLQGSIENSPNYNTNNNINFEIENTLMMDFENGVSDISNNIIENITKINSSMKKNKLNTILSKYFFLFIIFFFLTSCIKDPNSESNKIYIESLEKKIDVQDKNIDILNLKINKLDDELKAIKLKTK